MGVLESPEFLSVKEWEPCHELGGPGSAVSSHSGENEIWCNFRPQKSPLKCVRM